ncbi:MAG: LTA synthase family protein [Acidobacteriia bacterium]|nr:LTA synthase family protein [Terriglobia bacterium]
MPPEGSQTGSSPGRRWLGFATAQISALARDPFFWLTGILLLAKSFMALLLINNPDHSVLDAGYLSSYDFSVPIFVSFIAVPLSFGLLLKGRLRLAYYLALDAAFSVLMIADLWYFRAYSTFLSFMLWQETANLSGLWDSIISMARPVDLLFVADVVVVVPVVLLWRALYRGARRSIAAAVLVLAAALVCLAWEHLAIDVWGTEENHRFVETRWEARETISFQSPLGFHILDVWNVYLQKRPLSLSPAQGEAIRAWFAEKREPLPDNRYKGMLKGRNLIVVQIESLENCVIGRSVSGQAITPVLNGLLPNSLYFTNIYEQVNGGSSSDSDLMTNTSVYPVRHGSTFFRFPRNAYNALPRILRGAGYRTTLAMHPDAAVYWNWKNALTAIGFDTCLDESAFVNHETLGLGMSDEDFLTQAGTRITRQPEPFYAFLVTLTSHAPFDLPEKYRDLKLDEELATSCLGRAFQAFHYADRSIGVFLERLRRSGMLERSVVVFYGDHASVHRFYNDEVQAMEGLEDWMRDPRCLIPLIVYAPGVTGERIDVTGGHIDIMPTLLYLLGVDEAVTAETAMGRNLLRTGRDFAVLQDGTVVGRDKDATFSKAAVEGLSIADLSIRGNYFSMIGYGGK